MKSLILRLALISGLAALLPQTPTRSSAAILTHDPDASLKAALEQFRAGRNNEALAVLSETLKTHPGHAPTHQLMGLILSAQGKDDEALSHLQKSVELWPDHPVYWTNLAIFYLRHSRMADAEQALQKSLEAGSSSAITFTLLGLVRLEQNEEPEAVNFFKKSPDVAPDDVSSWYYSGLAHQSLA